MDIDDSFITDHKKSKLEGSIFNNENDVERTRKK